MPKFVKIDTQDDDVLYATFGELPPGKDAKKALLIKEGEAIEGVITEMVDSGTYGKIYKLKVDKLDKPVVITGKLNLNSAMIKGEVRAGDLVRITYIGKSKTAKGRFMKKFDLEVSK